MWFVGRLLVLVAASRAVELAKHVRNQRKISALPFLAFLIMTLTIMPPNAGLDYKLDLHMCGGTQTGL